MPTRLVEENIPRALQGACKQIVDRVKSEKNYISQFSILNSSISGYSSSPSLRVRRS